MIQKKNVFKLVGKLSLVQKKLSKRKSSFEPKISLGMCGEENLTARSDAVYDKPMVKTSNPS